MIGALSLPFLLAVILIGIAINGWMIYKPNSQGEASSPAAEPRRSQRRQGRKPVIPSDDA